MDNSVENAFKMCDEALNCQKKAFKMCDVTFKMCDDAFKMCDETSGTRVHTGAARSESILKYMLA